MRHLSHIVTAYPANRCEMGDEAGCEETPRYWLCAPASYSIPLLVCQTHADEEARYFGTPIPSAPSR